MSSASAHHDQVTGSQRRPPAWIVGSFVSNIDRVSRHTLVAFTVVAALRPSPQPQHDDRRRCQPRSSTPSQLVVASVACLVSATGGSHVQFTNRTTLVTFRYRHPWSAPGPRHVGPAHSSWRRADEVAYVTVSKVSSCSFTSLRSQFFRRQSSSSFLRGRVLVVLAIVLPRHPYHHHHLQPFRRVRSFFVGRRRASLRAGR